MVTRAATSLNRILRVTANLLFEKGEDVQAIARLLEGFVDRRMVQAWYEKFCEMNGVPNSINQATHQRRAIPAPPIDFEKIELSDLKERLEEEWSDF